MKALTLSLFLVSVVMAKCAAGATSDWLRSQGQEEVGEPHAHLALVAYPGPVLAGSKEVEAYAEEAKDGTFLNSPGVSSKNPLTPCALLAAGVSSVRLNQIWYGITVERKIPVPPPRTNILGMFDEDIKGGTVPMGDPGKAAEITARLFVWYSWAIDAPTNTLIHGMTQQQCLELLLSSPDVVAAKIQGVKPSELVFSHSPAVAHYSAMLLRDDSERFFKDVRREGFTSLSSKDTDNPVAPCSLLRAFRLASRLNEFWGQILTGSLRDTRRPMVEKFSDDLRKGTVPREDKPKAAEITAYLFASEMLQTNEVSEALISQATQQECLNEIFRPGLIRMRLLKEGKLPLVR
jgi:hypothetical protein